MKSLLEKSNIIPTLEMYLAEITPRQVERQSTRLQKIQRGDKVLEGELSETAQTLYTLGCYLKNKMIETRAKAENAVESMEEEEYKRESVRMACMAEIAMEMAWMEMHTSVDHWDGHEIGVREGWKAVIPAKRNGPESFFRGIGLLPDED